MVPLGNCNIIFKMTIILDLVYLNSDLGSNLKKKAINHPK